MLLPTYQISEPTLLPTYRDSIGLQADAQVVMVFASPSGQFYHDVTNPTHLSGLVHLDNFIMTRHFSSIYRDCAKTTPPRSAGWRNGNSIKPPGRYLA